MSAQGASQAGRPIPATFRPPPKTFIQGKNIGCAAPNYGLGEMISAGRNNYYIISLLGQGGVGKVFLVRELETGLEYAAKLSLSSNDPSFVAEKETMQAISHGANITTLHKTLKTTTGHDLFLYEYVRGEPLRNFITDQRQRNRKNTNVFVGYAVAAFSIIWSACRDLDVAHQRGFWHGDLCLDNILVEFNPRNPCFPSLKIIDWGLGREYTNRLFSGIEIGQMGKHIYMSPEQARGEACDGRSDIYGLGMILYQMLTFCNRPPLSGSPQEMHAQRANGTNFEFNLTEISINRYNKFEPELSQKILNVLYTMTAPRTQDRFQDVMQVQLAIADIMQDIQNANPGYVYPQTT